ncbi:VOC family protein [Aquimarina sp. AD10]|uniref:VOC family protein n=1 Tax=Aquimarina TaxID=290174 RepID=UPI000E54DCE2|nr:MULTISPECIES: VOC family protein [Aquimarina]AXT63167.1 VOC family protein [Aquimarina sp. AD10]RKM98618.1 VOC family protein [Aquimarina sp. AD10]
MHRKLGSVTLVVENYDEAIQFYVEKLNFKLIEDTKLSDSKRWVLISPTDTNETTILLAQAATPEQQKAIGNQTGGRVFMFLHTDNFWDDYTIMKSKGVSFLEEPRNEIYGTVVVFKDLYGNTWDLIEQKKP